jgi:long-subunit fatty acid transport protein
VDEYTVVDAEDFVGQTTGDTISVRLTQRQRSVFNWGLGVDHDLTEKLRFFGAFTTDRSFIEDPLDVANLATATWDIFHVSLGAEFAVQGIAITLGVAQSFGNEEDRAILGRPGVTSDFTYRSTRLLFGFSTGG